MLFMMTFFFQVMRPQSSAMIKVINPENGKILYEVDATDPSVEFVNNEMRFLPPQDDLFMGATSTKIEYELSFDRGVAMPETRDCLSESISWIFGVNGNKDCWTSFLRAIYNRRPKT